ncbi:MAG TPA: exodeoxyribonuclease III, partial [Kofleriaceae bacterium]
KVEDPAFPAAALRKAGYELAIFGQRSYNGVAIASKQPLTDVTRGFGDGEPDDEARVIAATTFGMRVVCVYVPNGQDLQSDRYPYKLAWFQRLRAYLERTSSPTAPLALLGDFNVTPDDRDVWSPEKWQGQIHVSPPERAALAGVVDFGLTDVFRRHHGDEQRYSWWDYRGVAFFKNQGLRIDMIYLTAPLVERCTGCVIDRNARKGQDASDHAPVIATISA